MDAASEKNLVQLAVVGAPHGVRGEVRLKPFTADPLSLGDYGPLMARDGRSFAVLALRPAKEVVVARLEGIDTREKAEAIKGLPLHVPRDRLPPSQDEEEFYHVDLIGLAVVDEKGAAVGKVTAVHDFGGGEMLDIRAMQGPSVLIPFTRAAVPHVDIAGGRLTIDRLAAGLVEAEEGDNGEGDA